MRISRPRHGTVIAYTALFFALSGTAYAASGALPSARSSSAPSNTSLPARYISVSAGTNGLANGKALRAALAKPVMTPRVLLLSPGNFNVDGILTIPATYSVFGAGPEQSIITGAVVTSGPDVRELGIKTNATTALTVKYNDLGGTHLDDLTIAAGTAHDTGSTGISTSGKAHVTADHVNLVATGSAFSVAQGPIVFRDGTIDADGLGVKGGQDAAYQYPQIISSQLTAEVAHSLSASGEHYCNGDYYTDENTAMNATDFVEVPNGEC